MIPLSLGEVAAAVGGRLADVPDPSTIVSGPVVADSREVRPGSLFAAIAGARVDGHDFVEAACAAGAVGCLTTRPVRRPAVVVDDVVVALGRLAAHVLRLLPDLTVVGITGSSGKTSTKDLVAQVAAHKGPTVAPPGSYNTEVGLPLTVLRSDRTTEVLVLEMGARGIGHIAYLCTIAPPDIGVVVNVGTAHVGEFGSIDAIVVAKAELVGHTKSGGVVVLNGDDARVAAMADSAVAPVWRFGRDASFEVSAAEVRLAAGGRPEFELRLPEGRARVALQVVGEHQVENALAAAAVGSALGLSAEVIAGALSAAVPLSRWRMEVTHRADGLTVVNDAYNANPESTAAALRALVDLAGRRRSWAVLGEMRELGAEHRAEHERVGRLAADLGIDRIVAVGPGAAAMIDGVALGGSAAGTQVELVADVDAAIQLLLREVAAGDVVLVKASRAIRLERAAAALLAVDAGGGDGA